MNQKIKHLYSEYLQITFHPSKSFPYFVPNKQKYKCLEGNSFNQLLLPPRL